MRASASIATGTSNRSPEASMSVVTKLKYSPARTWVRNVSPPKPSRKSRATGRTTKKPNATPARNRDDAPATTSSMRRRGWSCTAGITKA